MNTIRQITLYSLLVLALAACCEEDVKFTTFEAPRWAVDMNGYVDAPHWAVDETGHDASPEWHIDLAGDDEAPRWQAADDGTLQYSMTAVLRLSDFLRAWEHPDDRLAAFVDNECRGVATAEGTDGAKLYFLYIKGNNGDNPVTLRYYSAANRRIYELPHVYDFFQNEEHGTASSPEVAPFEQATPYAQAMQAVVVLPQQLQDAAAQGDMLAAFCGTQCRGVARPATADDGTPCYTLEVRGAAGDDISLKHYSASARQVYKSTERITFEPGADYGTASQPARPALLPENSMTAVVAIPEELQFAASGDDEVAAFVGGELAAAGVPVQAADGTVAYALTIRKTDSQANDVAFRYYNARNSYLYATGTVTQFAPDAAFGTLDEPQVLPISTQGKYPFQMTAHVALPEHLAAYADAQDELAAFAGDECRGVAEWTGAGRCRLTIIGNADPADIHLRYYSSRNAYLYQTDTLFPFQAGTDIGTESEPIVLNLYNVQ